MNMTTLIEPSYEEIKQIPIGQWTTVVLNGIFIPYIRGKDCLIWLNSRPEYCDRGRFLAGLDVLNTESLCIDWADGWQTGRYYFDLERAKAEVEAWLDCRKQLEPRCPHCNLPMVCVWADSTHGCGWYLTCRPCDYFDEDSFEPSEEEEEEEEEENGHIHRVMQVVLNPKPGEPTAWLDGEPIYSSREDDRT